MPGSINIDHATGQWGAGLSASSDISQGSVATHLRCSKIYSDIFYYTLFSDSDNKKILKIG